MKRNFIKKLIAGALTLAITATTLLSGDLTTVKAYGWADTDVVSGQTLTKDVAYEFTFNNPSYGWVQLQTTFYLDKQNYTIEIYDSKGKKLGDTVSVSKDDSAWASNGQYVGYVSTLQSNGENFCYPKGSLTMKVTCDTDTQASLHIYTYDKSAYQPKFDMDTYTVGVGTKKTLSVTNGTVTKWKSSKKSVATVNSKGVITAKKKGTTTITATLSDKSTVSCKVQVTSNVYAGTKLKKSDVESGSTKIEVYTAKFDSKGNLTIQFVAVNRTDRTAEFYFGGLTSLSSKVSFVNPNSQKVFKVGKNKAKSFTLKIKKSEILSVEDITGGIELNYY